MNRIALLATVIALGLGARSVPAAPPVETTRPGGEEVRGAALVRSGTARPASLGDACTALADDAAALAWNPAALASVPGFSAAAQLESLGVDATSNLLAVCVPIAGWRIGAALTSLSYGSFVVRDEGGGRIGDETLDDSAVTVGGAMPAPGWLGGRGAIGLAIEHVREAVGGSTVAATIGMTRRMGEHGDLVAAVQHIGAGFGSDRLPMRAVIGIRRPVGNRWLFAGEGGYGPAEEHLRGGGGVELRFWALALRLGASVEVPAGGGVQVMPTFGGGAEFRKLALDFGGFVAEAGGTFRASLIWGRRRGPLLAKPTAGDAAPSTE